MIFLIFLEYERRISLIFFIEIDIHVTMLEKWEINPVSNNTFLGVVLWLSTKKNPGILHTVIVNDAIIAISLDYV